MSLSDTDFESLDASQLLSPRKDDGSLPDITFLKLRPGTQPYVNKLGYQFDKNETSGIESIFTNPEKNTDNIYYNLQGMPVANPTKGLYIRAGKKIYIP
ncbi:hypothetical protein [uncultured Muribaculum sp.]|nr:hypothetical protein [uncultured Muribaculum sp.]